MSVVAGRQATPRTLRIAWWAMVVVTAFGVIASVPTSQTLQNSSLIVAIAAYFAVGSVVARRRPSNPIGWTFLAVATVSGLVGFANSVVQVALSAHAAELAVDPSGAGIDWPAWALIAAFVTSWTWFLLLYLMTFLTFLLFPDGLSSRRWRPLLIVGTIGTALVVVMNALWPTLSLNDDAEGIAVTVDNPLSPTWMHGFDPMNGAIDSVGGVIAMACLFGSAAAPFVRARRAKPLQRAQLRWFGFAVVLFLAGNLLGSLLPGGSDGPVSNAVFTGTVAFIPIACGIAILRYRLYDIDRIISRTAYYVVVTACVLGVYVLVVASASALLPDGVPSWIVAAATLVAAALVRPLLSRVQRVVDRRFNRERIDAQRAVEEYGARLADVVDPQVTASELLAVAAKAWAPASLRLWTGGA